VQPLPTVFLDSIKLFFPRKGEAMKLKFFSVNALDPEADQDSLDCFCNSHRLVSVDKRFVENGEFCFWSVCVVYLESSSSPAKPTAAVNKRAQVDYRETLNEEEFAAYSKLRELRKALADSDGVPIYAVFTNAQLADMVTNRATSLTALGEINGIGSAKLDKYGKHFTKLLQNTLTATPVTTTTQTDETPPHSVG
jgi:superfamily II DNA helicase RecQ